MIKSPRFSKTIGIVGGAGPMASAFLYTSIIEACQKQYQANDYHEFPEIVLVSYPFTRGDANKIRNDLSSCLGRLQTAGASLFCIASHSFHGLLPPLPQHGFVHLIHVALAEASRLRMSKALVLAAPETIRLKLYEQSSLQCCYPLPEDQQEVTQLIRKIAGGLMEETQASSLKSLILRTREHTAFDGVILACTEFPILHKKWQIIDSLPIVNTAEALVNQLVLLSQTGTEKRPK